MDVAESLSLPLLELLREEELRCVIEDFNRERLLLEQPERHR